MLFRSSEPEIKFNEIEENEEIKSKVVIGPDQDSLKTKLNSNDYKFYKFGESEVIGLKTKELQDFAEQYGLESIQ